MSIIETIGRHRRAPGQAIGPARGQHHQFCHNAEFELSIPVPVQTACRGDQTERTLTSRVTVRALTGPSESMTLHEDYSVACPQQAILNDINVTFEILSESRASELTSRAGNVGMPTEDLFSAYHFLRARARITNNSDQSAAVGYRLATHVIGETEKNLDSRVGDAGATAHDGYFTPVLLRPGETRTVDVWTDITIMSGAIDPC